MYWKKNIKVAKYFALPLAKKIVEIKNFKNNNLLK